MTTQFIGKALNSYRDITAFNEYFIINESEKYYDLYIENYFIKEQVRVSKSMVKFEKIEKLKLKENDVIKHLRGEKYNSKLANMSFLDLRRVPKVDFTLNDFIKYISIFVGKNPFALRRRLKDYKKLYFSCVRNARFLYETFFEGKDLSFSNDLNIISSYLTGFTSHSSALSFFSKYDDFAEILKELFDSQLNKDRNLIERKFTNFEKILIKAMLENDNYKLSNQTYVYFNDLIKNNSLLMDDFIRFKIAKIYFYGNEYIKKDLELANKYFLSCALDMEEAYFYLGMIAEEKNRNSKDSKLDPNLYYERGFRRKNIVCIIKYFETLLKNDRQFITTSFLKNWRNYLEGIEYLFSHERCIKNYNDCLPELISQLLIFLDDSNKFDSFKVLNGRRILIRAKYFIKHSKNSKNYSNLLEKINYYLDLLRVKPLKGDLIEIKDFLSLSLILCEFNIINNVKCIKKELNEYILCFTLYSAHGEARLINTESVDFCDYREFINIKCYIDTNNTLKQNLDCLIDSQGQLKVFYPYIKKGRVIQFENEKNESFYIYVDKIFINIGDENAF